MGRDNEVAIVGHGFVGNALHEVLNKGYVVAVYDKFKPELGTMEAVNSCKVAFLCVPTPMRDNKTCDLSAIKDVFGWLRTPIVVIKSTVPVGTTAQLDSEYEPGTVIHNPEFLRERSAVEDMLNANRVILGGDKKASRQVAKVYRRVYDEDVQYVFTDSKTSELIKYATNSYFATKVAFFNEIYDIAGSLGVDYDQLREYLLLEPRVGRHHTQVTEERGFGGTCLPKDINALIHTAAQVGYDSKLLKAVWDENCRVRDEFSGKEYE